MKKVDIKKLFKAIEQNDTSALNEILDANPEALEVLGSHNSYVRYKTPLMYALQCFNLEIAGSLLDRGADANTVMPAGPRQSVLAMCVARAYSTKEEHGEWIQLTRRLLDAGANPATGLWPALHAFGGIVDRADLIRLLLDRGADPDQQVGNSGNTVRELVQVNAQHYSPEVLALFGVEPEAVAKSAASPAEKPFLEHPTGEFHKARIALMNVMQQLDELGKQKRWINFSGQGRGKSDETYVIRDVAYRNGILDIKLGDRELDKLLKACGDSADRISRDKQGRLDLRKLTPSERGDFLNELFLTLFGLKLTKRGRDYGVCVEWV